jgi:hypothetical protein
MSALDLLEMRGLPRDAKLLNRREICPSIDSHDAAAGPEPARNARPEEWEVNKHPGSSCPEIPAVNVNEAPLRRRSSADCAGRASDSSSPNGWYGKKDKRCQRFEHASHMHLFPFLGGTMRAVPNKILHVFEVVIK